MMVMVAVTEVQEEKTWKHRKKDNAHTHGTSAATVRKQTSSDGGGHGGRNPCGSTGSVLMLLSFGFVDRTVEQPHKQPPRPSRAGRPKSDTRLCCQRDQQEQQHGPHGSDARMGVGAEGESHTTTAPQKALHHDAGWKLALIDDSTASTHTASSSLAVGVPAHARTPHLWSFGFWCFCWCFFLP